MSFTDRAKQGPPPTKRGLPCRIAVILEDLPKAERASFDKMLNDRDVWSHAEIHRAIEAEGFEIKRGQIENHRRGECRCPRST